MNGENNTKERPWYTGTCKGFTTHLVLCMVSELMCMQISHFIQPSISTNNSSNIYCLSWPLGIPKNNLETHQWLDKNVKRSDWKCLKMKIPFKCHSKELPATTNKQVCMNKACVPQVLSESSGTWYFFQQRLYPRHAKFIHEDVKVNQISCSLLPNTCMRFLAHTNSSHTYFSTWILLLKHHYCLKYLGSTAPSSSHNVCIS